MKMEINGTKLEGTPQELADYQRALGRTSKKEIAPQATQKKKTARKGVRPLPYTQEQVDFIKQNLHMKPRELMKYIRGHSRLSLGAKKCEIKKGIERKVLPRPTKHLTYVPVANESAE